jgi:hypothetical protein
MTKRRALVIETSDDTGSAVCKPLRGNDIDIRAMDAELIGFLVSDGGAGNGIRQLNAPFVGSAGETR